MDNCDSTVVKLAPHDPKVKGSSPVPAVVGGKKQAKACLTLRGYAESLIRLIMYAWFLN